jgi:hypothetical protein
MNTLSRSDFKTKNDLPYFETPDFANLGWVAHGFLTRKGGVSLPPYESLNVSHDNGDRDEQVADNKARIAAAFGFDPGPLVLLNQMHQDGILVLREPFETIEGRLEYDAVITDVPRVFLGIRTADCLPILIADRRKKVIAAVHAGRQGTALGITAKVIRKMMNVFDCRPGDLLAAMGPSIGACCYEIDERVFQPGWERFATSSGRGKWMLDLTRINIDQVGNEGLNPAQISCIRLCTCCRPDLFFSYRREGNTGRQLSFIGMV